MYRHYIRKLHQILIESVVKSNSQAPELDDVGRGPDDVDREGECRLDALKFSNYNIYYVKKFAGKYLQ